MKLKYYEMMPANSNVAEVIKYYESNFNAKVIKNVGRHINMKLFGEIDFYLWLSSDEKMQIKPSGYHIIKFDDSQSDLMMSAIEKIKRDKNTIVTSNLHDCSWGTTFFEFKDINNITWDFEINTK